MERAIFQILHEVRFAVEMVHPCVLAPTGPSGVAEGAQDHPLQSTVLSDVGGGINDVPALLDLL